MLAKYLRLLSLIGPFRGRRRFIIFICSLSIAVSSVIPFLIGRLVNSIKDASPFPRIAAEGLVILLLTCAASALNSYQNFKWHMYLSEYVNYFRLLMLKASFKRDIAFYRNKNEDFSTRILHDGVTISEDISVGFPMLILNVLRIGLVVGLMLYMNALLTLIPLFVIPVYLFLFHRINTNLRERSQEERTQFSQLSEMVKQILRGMFDIKINRKEEYFTRRFREKIGHYTSVLKGIKFYRAVGYSVSSMVSRALPILTLIAGGYLVSVGRFSLGYLFAFYSYLDFLYEPMSNLVDWYAGIQVSLGMCDRVLEFLDYEDRETEGKKVSRIETLEMKNLSFRYQDGTPVLDKINLSLKGGDVLAIVGPSGSGKSTLIDLLLKVWDGYEGSILVNGIELRELDKRDFYEKVSVLEQSPFLFEGSLRENICFDAPLGLDGVLKSAGLDELVEKKQGLDFRVTSGGDNLSGGERQRIALARVLAKSSGLVILDEFTSALDGEVEKEIVDSLIAARSAERMMIVVSHRPYPLQMATHVLTLPEAKVSAGAAA